MRIRLMIVDDDVQIREGIQYGIDWESIDVQEVRSYADGVMALEDFDKFRPHIILADIRMPGMDGLEFLKHVQERDSSVKVVLISAYSDFEYCQKAIRYGAVGYELKPLKVGKLIQNIQELVKTVREEEEGKEAYARYVESYKEKVTEELLEGKITDRNVLLGILERYFGMENAGYLVCMVLDWDQAKDLEIGLSVETEKLLSRYVEQGMRLFCFHGQYIVLASTANSTLFILEIQNRLKGIWRSFLSEVQKQGISISAGISGMVPVAEIRRGYEQALEMLRFRFCHGPAFAGIVCVDDFGKKGSFASELPPDWKAAVKAMDSSAMIKVVEEKAEELKKCRLLDPMEVRRLMVQALEELYTVAGIRNSVWVMEAQTAMEGYRYLDEYIEYWLEQCRGAAEYYHAQRSRKYSANVRRALDYIDQHYTEDIGVEQVAGAIGKTPNYFSSIFKQEVGIAFREYLNRYRIDRAREMIDQSDLLIYEIAEKVGYKDYTYFSQVFKKLTGKSPTSLRGRKDE